jgi:type II secretory pathway pseudopilin PulG
MRRTAGADAGFTYLTILFAVAIMGVGLALAGEVWHTAAMREREAELLHVGEQYRKAIERYYLGGPRQYPRALSDLLRDPRKPVTERYLRRLYPDPVARDGEWAVVKAPDGGVMGVHSRSEDKPIKSAGFQLLYESFEGAKTYSDWKFVYTPPAAAAPIKPAVPGAAAPAPAAPAAAPQTPPASR